MTDYHNPAWIKESRFRGPLDDVIIIPFAVLALAASKLLRFMLSILVRLLDYAFPLAMQIVWLPLFAAKVALRLVPLSERGRRRWSISIRRNWSRLRRKVSHQALERAVHSAFESGMASVFRKCRHLTPSTALLVILGAILWLPISFGAAILHPLATVIAKSKLLVLPAYPAAWPQAKKHPLVQLAVKGYETLKRMYVIRKIGFRFRQAEIASIAAVKGLERTVGVGSVVRWLRNAHISEHFDAEKPTQKLQSFFSRWSIKFSAEFDEAKERQVSDVRSLNGSGL